MNTGFCALNVKFRAFFIKQDLPQFHLRFFKVPSPEISNDLKFYYLQPGLKRSRDEYLTSLVSDRHLKTNHSDEKNRSIRHLADLRL